MTNKAQKQKLEKVMAMEINHVRYTWKINKK